MWEIIVGICLTFPAIVTPFSSSCRSQAVLCLVHPSPPFVDPKKHLKCFEFSQILGAFNQCCVAHVFQRFFGNFIQSNSSSPKKTNYKIS
eukprot:c18411_g1_i1 orf=710-979(-)